jgi:hypothetical protein
MFFILFFCASSDALYTFLISWELGCCLNLLSAFGKQLIETSFFSFYIVYHWLIRVFVGVSKVLL